MKAVGGYKSRPAVAMTAIVTLQVFSGRPDPNWPLTGKEEAEFERLVAGAPIAARPPNSLDEPLGYRGFRVHIDRVGASPSEFRVYHGWIMGTQIREDRGRVLERWLLNTGHGSIPSDLATYIQSEINAGP